MRPCPPLLLILAVALGACAPFPDLSDTVTEEARRAPYPALVPLDGLQARMAATRITPDTAPRVEARADGLRARAARLNGAVIDDATRARMDAGVPR